MRRVGGDLEEGGISRDIYSRHTEANTHTHTLTLGCSNLLIASTRQALYWSRNKLRGRRRGRLECILVIAAPDKAAGYLFSFVHK